MKKITKERMWPRAIDSLMRSKSLAAAARKVPVDERTMRRWMQDANFVAQYEAARKDLLHRGLGNLARKVFDAVEVLGQIAKDKGREFQGARSHAAANIIKLAIDVSLLSDFEQRLLALEKQGRSNEKFSID